MFSLKFKIMNYDCINKKLMIKLFDCLIRSILTYRSEIWICEISIKDNNLDKLPFEKMHNKFCKYLLGVHRKSSSFASRLELGGERIINFITALALKYNERLSELPADRFLKEVYNVDQALFDEGYKSWYSFIDQSVKKLSISPDDRYANQASQFMLSSYVNEISNNLKTMRSHGNDNKLCTFSYVYNEFRLQSYLSL